MHGKPAPQTLGDPHESHPQRWRVLVVLVLALIVTSIDHTIINVALPELVGDLGASGAQLQWVVASYTIVFAGLLLTAGSLGDRFGRRHALIAGLATFLAGSVGAALASSTVALIAARGVMGIGGALIMPTTLSILVNVFGDPRERAKAIAVWTAASGIGIAVGPIVGGALMRSFSWSSVFWINVPLLGAALVGALHVVPDSRDAAATRIDPVGAVLSIAAIGTLVYAIIEAPTHGWLSGPTTTAFGIGAVTAAAFVAWELRRDDPMLDIRLFADRGFSASSVGLAMLFFAMAGAVFMQAQYLQFILDYTPLAAGFALVPAAIGMLMGTAVGAHMALEHGGRATVTIGLAIASAGIAVQAALIDGTSYGPTGVGLLLFGLGAGITMPSATDLIMATLPPARAGVGSAVNDTVRELGGALGVAVIGSIAATGYSSSLEAGLGRLPSLPESARSVALDNVGGALHISSQLGANGSELASVARSAFVDSMAVGLWFAAGTALLATVSAWRFLPRAAVAHAAPSDDTPSPRAEPEVRERATVHATSARGHIGRIVAGSLMAGAFAAIAFVVGPLAGAAEHVITGSVLWAFAGSWAAIALLAARRTDQPQPWTIVPAAFMAVAGTTILAVAPTGNELGWIWPPVVAGLALWMMVQAHRALHSRTRVWLIYPVCVALLLSALGGAYETHREAADRTVLAMPGRLIDVGDHRLHIDCTGTGSPTVVLEPGLGEPSSAMAWIAPDVAATTRVCVYDRAGRGWSESAGHPQDGIEVATDLRTLLQRAGETGPYVLAGHSAGGIYVLNFAHLFPQQVAGVVLLDSMHPEQYTRIGSWPAFYETYRRASAVLTPLSRFGVGRVVAQSSYEGLPVAARGQERAFVSTPRHHRSVRDEFSRLRTAMAQAQSLTTLGDRPLVVLTAEANAAEGWMAAQADLAALSTNSAQRVLADAEHAMLFEDQATAMQSARAIRDVVTSIHTQTTVAGPAGSAR